MTQMQIVIFCTVCAVAVAFWVICRTKCVWCGRPEWVWQSGCRGCQEREERDRAWRMEMERDMLNRARKVGAKPVPAVARAAAHPVSDHRVSDSAPADDLSTTLLLNTLATGHSSSESPSCDSGSSYGGGSYDSGGSFDSGGGSDCGGGGGGGTD